MLTRAPIRTRFLRPPPYLNYRPPSALPYPLPCSLSSHPPISFLFLSIIFLFSAAIAILLTELSKPMASSENLASVDPSWMMYHRSSFADSSFLLPDTFTSFNNNNQHHHQSSILNNLDMLSSVLYSDAASPLFNSSSHLDDNNATPFTPSHVSGSEPDSPVPRLRNGSSVAVTVPSPRSGGKVSKRKSRASKRCQTTFITANPANFRQMVQQVTGVRLNGGNSGSYVPIGALLNPQSTRASRNYGPDHHLQLQGDGCLPTLDTSSYLLEYQQQQNLNSSGVNSGARQVAARGPTAMTGGDAAGGSTGFDFEGFSSFPTLESWKVI